MVVTGVLMLRGRPGITGRSAWLVGLGTLMPLAPWIYRIYAQ